MTAERQPEARVAELNQYMNARLVRTVSWRAFMALLGKELRLLMINPFMYGVLGFYVAFYALLSFIFSFLAGVIELGASTKIFLYIVFFFNSLLAAPGIAREARTGTLVLLLAAPLSETAIILAKYLALLSWYSVMLLLTLPVYGYLAMLSHLPAAEVLLQYIVLWLFGANALALGLCFSVLAARETQAAFWSIAFVLSASLLTGNLAFFPLWLRSIVQWFSLLPAAAPFIAGRLELQGFVYYGIYTLGLLRVSVFLLQQKRWS